MQNIQSHYDTFVVVDLDTGTVIGTNCVLVKEDHFNVPIALSDDNVINIAKENGRPLFAEFYSFGRTE